MRVTDSQFINSTPADIAKLQAYMNGKASAEFDAIRNDVAGFDTLEDGELSQIALDAGFETDAG